MKILLNIIRFIVGILFIFSGLVKANDPLGLSYKMDEFFAAWNWNWAFAFSLFISIAMIAFEIIAGVALLLGWKQKLFSWLLLLLTIFFTFLTGYAVYSGKFKSCGCFGDCLPLTAKQSFLKDVVLSALVIFLFANRKKILPLLSAKPLAVLMLLTLLISVFGQLYILEHLPLKDCLPYAVGNDLNKQMQPGPNFQAAKIQVNMIYKHNGKEIKFDTEHMPADLNDTTYEYIGRNDVVLKEAVDEPKIEDFSLHKLDGTDTTQGILNQKNSYAFFFIRNFDDVKPDWQPDFEKVVNACKAKQIPLILISSNGEQVDHYFNKTNNFNLPVFICDGTVMKTFLRSKIGIVLMDQATVKGKYNITDMDKAIKKIWTIIDN